MSLSTQQQAIVVQLEALVTQEAALLVALSADAAVDPPVDPPATTNTYISRAHPKPALVSNGGAYAWGIGGSPDAQGLSAFIANGSFGTMVKGTKLVLQDDKVYAKQLDGTWVLGPGTAKATVVVVEPAGD